jgi:hypothetical protein
MFYLSRAIDICQASLAAADDLDLDLLALVRRSSLLRPPSARPRTDEELSDSIDEDMLRRNADYCKHP